MTRSTDQTSPIKDLKFNHKPVCNTAGLKIYSQLTHLKKNLMNLSSKKFKYDTCSNMKEKAFRIAYWAFFV